MVGASGSNLAAKIGGTQETCDASSGDTVAMQMVVSRCWGWPLATVKIITLGGVEIVEMVVGGPKTKIIKPKILRFVFYFFCG